MLRIGLFLRTQKGFFALRGLLTQCSTNEIAFVVAARDHGMKKDFYKEIKALCRKTGVPFFDAGQKKYQRLMQSTTCILAAGWNRMIEHPGMLMVFHDSLLPRYRGFIPLVNMLINGEKRIGATVILASEEYDRGDIVIQKSVRISYPIKIQQALEKICHLYAEMAAQLYEKLKNKKLALRKQNEKLASYSPWLDECDYLIDWSWSAEKIKRFIDATGFPYFGAATFVKDRRYRILQAEAISDIKVPDRERHLGKVIFFRQQKPVVICGKGLLKIDQIVDQDGITVPLGIRTRFR